MKLKEKMQQFMAGRYGADQLSKLMMAVSLLLLVISMFTRLDLFYILAVGMLILTYLRMFSKNVPKRYAENQKFMTWRYKYVAKWNTQKQHFKQRKTYRFFQCPSCKQKVRVPRGKGKISITCPKCQAAFLKNS
ncbi:zinc-ribbon domain-containing protein [Lachnospiraceae bacterium ZAX-1]